jgi:hypothetical protein
LIKPFFTQTNHLLPKNCRIHAALVINGFFLRICLFTETTMVQSNNFLVKIDFLSANLRFVAQYDVSNQPRITREIDCLTTRATFSGQELILLLLPDNFYELFKIIFGTLPIGVPIERFKRHYSQDFCFNNSSL